MNTANWIPDLFMKRVMNDEKWTLFSPDTVPDLHDKYGEEFERAYVSYETKAKNGDLSQLKSVRHLTMEENAVNVYETGHPWITLRTLATLEAHKNMLVWCTVQIFVLRLLLIRAHRKLRFVTSVL